MKKVLPIFILLVLTACLPIQKQDSGSTLNADTLINDITSEKSSDVEKNNEKSLQTIDIPEKYQWLYEELIFRVSDEYILSIGQEIAPSHLRPIAVIATADLDRDGNLEFFVGTRYNTGQVISTFYNMFTSEGELAFGDKSQHEKQIVVPPIQDNDGTAIGSELFNDVQYISESGQRYCLAFNWDTHGTIHFIEVTRVFKTENGWDYDSDYYEGENYNIGEELLKNPTDKAEKLDTVISEFKSVEDVQAFFTKFLLKR